MFRAAVPSPAGSAAAAIAFLRWTAPPPRVSPAGSARARERREGPQVDKDWEDGRRQIDEHYPEPPLPALPCLPHLRRPAPFNDASARRPPLLSPPPAAMDGDGDLPVDPLPSHALLELRLARIGWCNGDWS